MYKSIQIVGRGVGQVMFQNNALSGALMLVGIACNSWLLAILAITGTIVATWTASLLKYDKAEIGDGLYGFNGTLVGIAVGVFMEINPLSLLLLVLGSVLSTWIAHWFRCQSKLSGFTSPFILVVWLLLIGCRYGCPSVLLPAAPGASVATMDVFSAFNLNIGQVMFQGDTLSGMFFLFGILVNSRMNAIYTVLGATLPLFLVLFPHIDISAWNAGLLGYNGVLCAIALGDKTRKGAMQAVFSIVLSIVLQLVGMQMEIVTLTAPFVLSVWVTQALFSIYNFR